MPGYGRLLSKFDQSFSYSGGLIESCPKPGTFDHLPPFAIHILNPLDMRNHRDPLFMGQKCTQYGRETNTSQVFGNCGSLSPPPTLKVLAVLAEKARVICGQWDEAKRIYCTYRKENSKLKAEIEQVVDLSFSHSCILGETSTWRRTAGNL